MSVDRCPSCAAAVPAGAPWCTLCWAPLRKPEPEPAFVSVPATDAVADSPADAPVDIAAAAAAANDAAPVPGTPAFTPASLAPDVPAQSTEPDPLTAPLEPAAPVSTTFPTQAIGWPCVRCNISVPIDEDACPNCGRRFLEAPLGEDAGLVDKLPAMTSQKGFTAAVIVAGSFGVTLLLVVLLAVLGLLFKG